MEKQQNDNQKKEPAQNGGSSMSYYSFFIVLVVLMLLNALVVPHISNKKIIDSDYGTFVEKIEKGKIKEDMQILKSLSQMGNNLNQFVKVSRFNNMREMEMAAVYLLELMRNIIAKLSDDWKSYKRKKL